MLRPDRVQDFAEFNIALQLKRYSNVRQLFQPIQPRPLAFERHQSRPRKPAATASKTLTYEAALIR
jgi:hypothetical protein